MIPSLKRLVGRRSAGEPDEVSKPLTETDKIRITNETVAARREEVLGSARKYIYPLQASKHRVVKFSVSIFIVALVGFLVIVTLELYKFQSTSSFMYGVTQVVPFPVAVVNSRYLVSYDSYLFELRHYMHYYQTQQHVDFSSAAGRQQLLVFKQRSLDQALQNAYVQRLADANNVTVSNQQLNEAVALVRSQNRLGASNQVFQNVLSEFWGWSVDDFKRELHQELLAQNVVDKLDTQTHDRAKQALEDLGHGADFATLAKQVSDDASTRDNGGSYGIPIGKSTTDIAPQIVNQLFQMHVGQYSTVISTGYTLEIVKVISIQGAQIQAAHISFNFQPITTYTMPLEGRNKPRLLVHI